MTGEKTEEYSFIYLIASHEVRPQSAAQNNQVVATPQWRSTIASLYSAVALEASRTGESSSAPACEPPDGLLLLKEGRYLRHSCSVRLLQLLHPMRRLRLGFPLLPILVLGVFSASFLRFCSSWWY